MVFPTFQVLEVKDPRERRSQKLHLMQTVSLST